MDQPITASELMTQRVLSLEPSQTLHQLVDFLRENRIHGAMVKQGAHLVGVVSYSDVLIYLSDAGDDGAGDETYRMLFTGDVEDAEQFPTVVRDQLGQATVGDVMTPVVFSVESTATVGQIAERMAAEEVHRLVVTKDGVSVGLISSTDLLRAVVDYETALFG